MEEIIHVWRQAIYEKFLNFAVNLKLLLKIVLIIIILRDIRTQRLFSLKNFSVFFLKWIQNFSGYLFLFESV